MKKSLDFFIHRIYAKPVGIKEMVGGTYENINKRKICITFNVRFGYE